MISKNQIKYIQSLHHKKHRQAEKRFIAEGVKTCLEIIQSSPDILESIYCTENFLLEYSASLHQKNIQAVTVTETQLKQISALVTPNEVLAVCRQFTHELRETNFDNDFAFYLDGIRDPGNLGTIIRICSWFGIKELFCSDDTVELYNPKCIQSCMGSFLRVKVYYLPLQKIVTSKKPQKIFAADLQGTPVYDIRQASGLIIIGNEANGISSELKKMATDNITIPSAKGDTESLNAAVATAMIASEFFRKKIS